MPDRLKDAIVEIHYADFLPSELIPGLTFQALDDSYNYTTAPIRLNRKNIGSKLPNAQSSLIFNDKIKVLLRPNSFIFNFLDEYIGWEEYSKEISKFLESLISQTEPIEFIRASVRYISEYQEINLGEAFKFDFTYGMPHVQSDKYTFRSEFSQDSMSVFLNLQNSVEIDNEDEERSISISIVDIDVLKKDFKTKDLNEFIRIIDSVHDKQKEVFFSIIREDFLSTLNPEY